MPLKHFRNLGIDGIPLTLVGYGIVALLLLPTFIKQYPLWQSQQKYIWIILILSGIANLSFTTAIMHGDVIRVMVLFYLIPAWGVLGGWFFLQEKMDAIRLSTVSLALIGAFFVLGGFSVFNSPPSWIDGLALLSGFALSMNNVAFRASSDLPLVSKLGAIFLGSFFLAALLIIIKVQPMPIAPAFDWLMVIAFVISWIFIATISTQWAVTKMEVGRASILLIVELIAAIVSAMWIAGENPSKLEILGGLFILCAAIIETRRPKNH